MKSGDWVSVANGATDARDKLRRAHVILMHLYDRKRYWGGLDWISVSSVETAMTQVRELIEQAGADLNQGLKGRTSTAGTRKSSGPRRTVVK